MWRLQHPIVKKTEQTRDNNNEVEKVSGEKIVEILDKIHNNVPFFEVLPKKRKLKDCEIGEITNVKRGRFTLDEGNERIKSKLQKLIRMIKPQPPPNVQECEPPHKRKKNKGSGYERWLDKWTWKYKVEEPFLKEPSRVLTLMTLRAMRC